MVSLLTGFIFQPGLILAQTKTTTKSVADVNMGNVVGSTSTSVNQVPKNGYEYYASGLTATGAYTGMENACVLQLKWGKSQSILPQDEKYYKYRFFVTQQVNGKNTQQLANGFLDYNTSMKNLNAPCGTSLYIQLYTISSALLNSKEFGLVEMWYTIGSPNNQSATDWLFTVKPTTGKTGNVCTANIVWTKPPYIARTSNPLASWGVTVSNITDNKTVYQTTSPLPFNATSVSIPGNKLVCGQTYVATVAVYSSKTFDLGSNRHTERVSFFAGTAAESDAKGNQVGPDAGVLVQTQTNQTNIDTSTGGKTACNQQCEKPEWWNLSFQKNMRNTMCQMQCGIIDWYASMIKLLFENILIKSIL